MNHEDCYSNSTNDRYHDARVMKLVIIGDSGTGKSQLLSRYVRDKFTDDSEPTIGLDFAVKSCSLDDRVVRVQIWDLAGKSMFRNLTSSYYQGTTAALVVYDITKVRSFENATHWLDNLRSQSDCPVVMLVGNKLDLRSQRSVPTLEAQKFAKENNCLFLETSAKHSTNVQKAFHRLVEHANEMLTQRKLKLDVEIGAGLENGAKSLSETVSKHALEPRVVVQTQPKQTNNCFNVAVQKCVDETKDICSKVQCCFY